MRNPLSSTVSSCVVRHLLRTLLAALAVCALWPTEARAQVNVPTYHRDNARTGLNAYETILTPANVNTLNFGKLFSYAVDGYTYAQPLYLSNFPIAGKGYHNVVIAATQNDSVYAFDADDNTGANAPYLWYNSLIPVGEAVVTSGDVGTGDIVPIIGITGTPVVDLANGTLYVVAKTRDGLGNFFQRLHALNIHTGLDKPGSPVLIQASVNCIGDANINGVITFNPLINTCSTTALSPSAGRRTAIMAPITAGSSTITTTRSNTLSREPACSTPRPTA
jgi:hypothetical protein